MPTLPYLTDTSTQLTGTYTASTAALDNFTTSNYVIATSNTLQTNINTKQNTLTAATNLVGIGSSITSLDYTKITLNKPTDFQANWNTTVINKPSVFPADMTNIYSKTETNNLLSAKEANLTFTAPLTRTTNTIGINLSSYSTTGNDASYLLKTGGTMTGAIVNTSATASDFKGIYIMHAARQSHFPYLPNGQFYLRAPVNIDNENDYLSFGSRTGDNIIRLYGSDFGFGINSGTLRYNVPMGSVHRFYHGATNTVWINDAGRLKATTFEGSGSALTDVPYTALTGTAPFYTKTETNTIITNSSNYASNVSNVIITNVNNTYLKLAGGTMAANANITLSGTGTFTGIHSGNGAALTNLPLSAYSTTGNDANYVLKTGSTMTGLLSGTTINTTGNIGIGITNPPAPLSIGTPDVLGSDGFICIGKYKASVGNRCFKIGYDDGFNMCFGDFGATLGSTSWKPMQFNINWNSGNVGIGTSGQTQKLNVDGTTYFNGNSTVIGTLTATTFSGSGANLTNLPLSSYSTTGNDASYVLKSGSTMTGNLTVNADLILKNSTWHKSADGVYRLYYGNNDISYYCCGSGSTEGHIFMDSSYNHIFKIKNNRDIEATGTLNILTTTGITPIFIKSTATNSINNIELKNNANNSSYIGIGGTGYSGNYANNLFLQSPNALILNSGGIGTGGTPKMIILLNGNVGIGTATPQTLLHIKGTNTALTIMSQGGTGATSQLNLSTYDHLTNLSPCSLIATDNGSFGSTFQIKQKTSGANANAQFTSLSIDASGNSTFIGTLTAPTINATSNFNINSVNINNWLFNNNGILHEANQNFNNVGKYGYTFIHGLGSAPLNGPATGDTQYYSWYIGLGSEYPAFFGTVGSYGMQFAIGRNDTNPKLCIRRNQNNSWTAWQGITAEQATTATTATSLTSGDKTISGSLTVNGNLTVQDGYAINFGASGADGRIYRTGGQVYIEGDDYIYFKSNFNTGTSGYFNQGTLYTSSALQSGGSLSVATTATISGLTRLRQIFNYGETLTYNPNFTGSSGWFWTTNHYWDGYGTASYLRIAITCSGIGGCYWYGRAYLSGGGGFYGVICDFRTPDNNNGNQITVQDWWSSNGWNALRISILNVNYAGNFNIKISG